MYLKAARVGFVAVVITRPIRHSRPRVAVRDDREPTAACRARGLARDDVGVIVVCDCREIPGHSDVIAVGVSVDGHCCRTVFYDWTLGVWSNISV